MVKIAHLIPLFPILAFLINIFFGRKLKGLSAIVSIVASGISLVLAVVTFQGLQAGESSYTVLTWLTINNIPLDFGVIVDPLTCMMLLVVTIVGTLIQIYSIGYMHDDPRYSRFFAYISLFMASMLGLVLADNFLMLYIFWEGVGLCSYLLIAFWFERPAAARAGLKAFVTTRIGDTGLLIGIFILFLTTKTLYFKDLAFVQGDGLVLTIVALLIFSGAVGKSAQFPLHVWLPDAMEGPTAVSALIHAATMVAAGVYLVARTYGLFLLSGVSLIWVAYIGAISALMAASIATVNNDIKRILAYSTISQLGLMMLGLGVGGFSAGTFHLMTHAFFKALLFLCAGSVIHSVGTQDIQKMGGLLPKMKVTGAAFIIGSLAIAGVPPFAGFWSKDEILSETLKSHHPVLFAVALLTSLLTAFYMFRLIFLVLFGRARSGLHAHESPATMTVPLIVLAVFSAGIGLVGSPLLGYAFQNFIHSGGGHEGGALQPDYFAMGVSSLVSFLGIGLAYVFYMRGNKILPKGLRAQFGFLYRLLSNKYYVDEIYDAVLVKPCVRLAEAFLSFDVSIIDGMVNAVGNVVRKFSGILRLIQTGLVQNYLLIQIVALILIILTLFKGKI